MGYFILKNFDKIFFRKFLAPRSTETNGAHFTSAEITRYGQKKPKTVIFLTFYGFFDVGKRLWRWFWTHIRFPAWRPSKTQAIDHIWCPTDLFLTVFKAFQRAFQETVTYLYQENMQKRWFFEFFGFLDFGKRLWRWLWTRIRFSHRRPGEIQAKDSIWCLVDVFLTVFEAFWWAFRADMQKSEEKHEKKLKKVKK